MSFIADLGGWSTFTGTLLSLIVLVYTVVASCSGARQWAAEDRKRLEQIQSQESLLDALAQQQKGQHDEWMDLQKQQHAQRGQQLSQQHREAVELRERHHAQLGRRLLRQNFSLIAELRQLPVASNRRRLARSM